MTIWNVGKNKFAIGKMGTRATYVVAKIRNKFVGVRGQRPILARGRFETVKLTNELKAAFGG
jgi:hypothetical protein